MSPRSLGCCCFLLAVWLNSDVLGQPAPIPAAVTPAATPAANPAATPSPPASYQGLGLGSISSDQLARFAPPPLPSEVSRRIQSMLDVRSPGTGLITPDGKRLFFTWSVTGTRQVWRLDGPQRFPVQLTGGEDPTLLAGCAPDGSFLLVLRDRNGEENPGLYLMAPEGGPLRLIQHQPGVQTFPQYITDDSASVIYRANDIHSDSYALYRWNRATGERELLFDQPGLWNLVGYQPDGRLLLEKELGSAVVEVYEWDPATRRLTPIAGQGEQEEYTAAYGAVPGEVLLLTPKLGEFRRLYSWRGAASPLKPITPEIAHDIEGFRLDRARTRLLYSVNEDGFTRLSALDARTYQPLVLPKLPQADHVVAVAQSPDGRYATLFLDTGTAPGQSYVVDWKKKQATAWQLPSAPEVDLASFVRATRESYPARDGTRIPMLVRRPRHCAEANPPCPVIVEFHGGPEGQARPGFNTRAQLYVDAGFIHVEPNVRGSDGFGKTWFHADDRERRLTILTDIHDCASYIRQAWARGGQSPKLGILGGSYGGYSVLIGMTMFAGAYDAGVSIVGIANLLTFLRNTAPYRRALRVNEYGDPEREADLLLKLSPISYIDRVTGPLLIIQGANDPRVPVGEALLMHQALVARGIVSPLIIFPDEGHGAQKRGNQVAMLGHALRFFQEHLQGKK